MTALPVEYSPSSLLAPRPAVHPEAPATGIVRDIQLAWDMGSILFASVLDARDSHRSDSIFDSLDSVLSRYETPVERPVFSVVPAPKVKKPVLVSEATQRRNLGLDRGWVNSFLRGMFAKGNA